MRPAAAGCVPPAGEGTWGPPCKTVGWVDHKLVLTCPGASGWSPRTGSGCPQSARQHCKTHVPVRHGCLCFLVPVFTCVYQGQLCVCACLVCRWVRLGVQARRSEMWDGGWTTMTRMVPASRYFKLSVSDQWVLLLLSPPPGRRPRPTPGGPQKTPSPTP